MEDIVYIEKLSDYIEYIENLKPEFDLSRGQGKDYELLPSALRKKDGKNIYSKREIDDYLNEFKINAYNFMENNREIREDDLEWMLYAQHYGLPTKLLDFTKSHIISLMFAVEKAFDEGENPDDGIVYFLNSRQLNLKFSNSLNIIQKGNELESVTGPVVVQSRKIHKRIQAQNGVFVYFTYEDSPLDKSVDEEILLKVVIKGENKKNILASLFSLGIGFSSLYPELNYLTKDILMRKTINQYFAEEK